MLTRPHATLAPFSFNPIAPPTMIENKPRPVTLPVIFVLGRPGRGRKIVSSGPHNELWREARCERAGLGLFFPSV